MATIHKDLEPKAVHDAETGVGIDVSRALARNPSACSVESLMFDGLSDELSDEPTLELQEDSRERVVGQKDDGQDGVASERAEDLGKNDEASGFHRG